jgi:nicotinamide mononucleotide (NMN) deamidase PncC
MADGVKDLFRSTIGLSTTGVAGPDTQEGQPVGTLFVSVSEPSGTFTKKLSGPTVDREAVRSWAVTEALKFLVVRLESASERL